MPAPTLDRIAHEMYLREPQADSLLKFAGLIGSVDLPKMDQARIKRLLQTGGLEFTDPYARLSFALATGVGKTRLMGAIAAFLFLEKQSRHFVMLAPSNTIYRKMLDECGNTHPKYLFKGLTGFPLPEVVHAGNLGTFQPEQTESVPAPTLFILTPGQIRPRVGSESERRMRRESEEFGPSFVDYLAALPDLVVFLDEGHRYSQDQEAPGAWAQAIIDLKPKVVVEMTATPSNPKTILYRYDLREALREGKYIKNVAALVESRQAAVTDKEWDEHTLLEGVNRLEVKKGALAAYQQNFPEAPKVKPVLLVVCRDAQNHAPAVEKFLESRLCMNGSYRGKVLRVDSTLPEDDWMNGLLNVEDAGNPYEIVVNVGMLKEGWDVTNVCVIAPLRAMVGETLATQTIGRGLRLPFGTRTGEDELDTLDVLAFGRETVQEVINQAKQVGVTVRENMGGGEMTFLKAEPAKRVQIQIPAIALHVVNPPSLSGFQPKCRVDVDVAKKAAITRVEAGSGEVTVAGEALQIEVTEPAKRLAQLLCREIPEIGGQESEAIRAVRRYFENNGCADASSQRQVLQAYGNEIYTDLHDQIDELIKRLETKYKREGNRHEAFEFHEVTHSVPKASGVINREAAVFPRDKSRVVDGWAQSLFPQNKFDTKNEFVVATILDKTAKLTWIRNPVRQFGINTQAGWHYPDFLVVRPGAFTLLEVKDRAELNDETSDAHVKGSAATEWCEQASKTDSATWVYWAIPDDAVPECATLEDLKAKRYRFPLTPTSIGAVGRAQSSLRRAAP